MKLYSNYSKRYGKEAVSLAKSSESNKKNRLRPALTPEARENQLIALAMDRAEEKLLDGTASSQMIVHFLKLGSTKERLEKEKMEEEKKLLEAKTKAMQAQEHSEELYRKALDAMKSYSGHGEDFDEFED